MFPKQIGKTTIGLMGVVAGMALLLAILRHAIEHWGRGELLTLTIGSLLLATIPMAIYGPSLRRAFWDGFALFGWLYLIVTVGPCPWNSLPEAPPLPTTRLFETLYPRIYPNPNLLFRNEDPWDVGTRLEQLRLRYLQACHAIMSLLFGSLGGVMLRSLATRRASRSKPFLSDGQAIAPETRRD
jgi:hypothetical protein